MGLRLFDEIEKNASLIFIDAKNKDKYLIEDILFDITRIEKTQKQLVFLYCKNQLHSVGMYFSLLKNNFTIALLNEELSVNLKVKLENTYQPNMIFDISRSDIRGYKNTLIKSNSYTLSLFISIENKINIHDNVKVLLSTSGTTGSSKFVKLSENNLLENANSISDYLPIIPEDVTPLNLPFFYSYGLSVLHTNALNGGAIICNTDDVLNKKFWNQFKEFGFTSIAGVPFLYEMLDRIGFRRKQYPTLRYISQAGGNLNEKTKQRFLDYCIDNSLDFYVMYGQTEAAARISFVRPSMLQEKITSIGQPILNGKLSIDNDTKELLYEGPNIFGGYAEKKEDLSTWEEFTKLYTGDLAKKDEDDFYYITGRMKRFIKIFGSRVNLDELEAFLKLKLDGTNFACLGVKDKFIVVFTDTSAVNIENIKNTVVQELKIHSSVIKHKMIDQFPLTSNGKINYKELQKSYEL